MPNIINGTSGADGLNGLSGDNVINGLAGNDKLNGGAGLDTMDGGTGSDTLSGNSGNDTLIYTATENAGSTDVYDGGSGKDYLQLNLTLAQWNSGAVQTDIANYLNFIDLNTQWRTQEANNAEFHFTAFDLTASKIEFLRVVVDGVALTPEDNIVALGTDGMTAGENTAGVSGNLFVNDSVADQVKTFSYTGASHGAVSILTDFSVVSAPSAIATYTPTGTYWDYLAAGEFGTDSFTYTVTDADNDVQTTTVTVTIAGANDAVLITSGPQTGSVVEDADTTPSLTDSLNAAGTVAFSDVDLSDSHSVSFAASPSNTTSLGTFALGSVSEAPNAATGSVGWTYALTNASRSTWPQARCATETYTVTVDDSHGSTTTQDVVITITGTNDVVTITSGPKPARWSRTRTPLPR
jgi:VCBS repeat-containing protein